MGQLPTPPATPALRADLSGLASLDKSHAELSKELDSVLERYLHLLDRQQRLQDEIGREFSSGFFSLARANTSCPPGRRYGEDYYDERMKAIKKLSIGLPSTNPGEGSNQTTSNPSFAIESALPPPSNTEESKTDSEDGNDERDSDTSSTSQSSNQNEKDKLQQSKKPRNDQKSSNPINCAQQSFCAALEGPIPALVNVMTEMREVERDVEALRSQLAAAIVVNEGYKPGKS
ncbi:hypothetical protein ACJ72_01529 [Emergomyces africanus]|uniref:Vacuolar ATPase assembly protein VMA22 n=1 Tax=Emergomyces africanus TaxID=1955775 RepID=A0A1B7P514_9EURO|nr:hypothetical protein ACJ72_01529 [Emergomyces africanus]